MSVIRSYNLNQTEAITDAPAQIIRVFDRGVLIVNAEAGAVTSVNGKTGVVVLAAADVDAATEAQGTLADSAVQLGDLATVATTGDYDDLTNTPTLGTAAAAATGDFDPAGAAAAAQSAAVATAEAYTDAQIAALPDPGAGTVTSVNTVEPVDGDVTLTPADIGAATSAQGALADTATQPADLGTAASADTTEFATAVQGALADSATQPGDLATVATTGAYADLTGTPTIPDSADDIGAVPTTRTVNGHALSANVTVTASDVSAVPTTRTVNSKALSADITLSASDVSAVPTTRTVNSKALSADITLSASDVSAVPTTRTVAGHALSSDVTLTDSDVTPTTPNDQTGTTYTFVAADAYRLVTGSNASAQTFTIPPNSSVAFALGTSLQVYNKGAGLITLAAGSGVTIRTPRGAKIAVQYGLAQAVKVAADTWAIAGDLTT